MNKKLGWLFLGLFLAVVLVVFFYFFKSEKKEMHGYISGIFGSENYVVSHGKKMKLALYDPIQVEDTLITGASSSVEVIFDVKDEKGRITLINIYENSELKIQETFLKRKNKFQAQLLLGYIKVLAKNLLQTNAFQIRTPNATIGIRGTKLYVQYVKESQTTHLHVVEVSEKKEVVIAPEKQAETVVPAMTTATVIQMQPPELKSLDTRILPQDPIYVRDLEKLKELLIKGKTDHERYRVYAQKIDGSFIFGKEQNGFERSKLVYTFDGIEGLEVYFESSQNRVTLSKNTVRDSALPIYFAFYSSDKIRVKRIMGLQETFLEDVYGNHEGQFFNILLWESLSEETAPITIVKVVIRGTENKKSKIPSETDVEALGKSESANSQEQVSDSSTPSLTEGGEKVHACFRLSRQIEARRDKDYLPHKELDAQIQKGWAELEGKDFNYRKNLYELIYKDYVLGDEFKCRATVDTILASKALSNEIWKNICNREFLSWDTPCPKISLEICGFTETQCKNKLDDFNAFYTSLRPETVLEKCNFDEVEQLGIKLDEAHKQSDALFLEYQKLSNLCAESNKVGGTASCDAASKAKEKWKKSQGTVNLAYEVFEKRTRECKPVWIGPR